MLVHHNKIMYPCTLKIKKWLGLCHEENMGGGGELSTHMLLKMELLE